MMMTVMIMIRPMSYSKSMPRSIYQMITHYEHSMPQGLWGQTMGTDYDKHLSIVPVWRMALNGLFPTVQIV